MIPIAAPMMTTRTMRTSLAAAPTSVDWREIVTEVCLAAVADDWKKSMKGITTAPVFAASRK